jgi:hypothetical protein
MLIRDNTSHIYPLPIKMRISERILIRNGYSTIICRLLYRSIYCIEYHYSVLVGHYLKFL